ncbi:related to HMX1 ER localized, heme-binding peroxidase involved in the degradation of heme [Rhynchosporium agropyri]|uniref:Related to HMX1 ER localized, heme-binding peroxidase involved in the degradation of heme n=1 Tax=Rhynchosporium agropyri TaxID=914238 RepID=A0A1E1KCE6_9HELO|nr:related to HMX1 ER localized, heme-binding peroxidase involved in the degradation of heme [Rhynchosporium agropyri]
MSDNDTIPTPSPLPSPPIAPHSLSERINRSTRPLHTQLNRLILTRLPLALPPYTTNPSTYVSGLLHITPIYATFEDLWASLLVSPSLPTTLDACEPGQPLLDSRSIPLISNTSDSPLLIHTPKICTRTQSLLSHLRIPGLLRAGRLIEDIRTLTNTPDHQINVQLRAISHSGPLAEFLQHTKSSVETNPHVLLAYAWVLYMALFSGGRYLRLALKEAGGQGEEFWTRSSSCHRPYSLDDTYIPPRSTSRPPARNTKFSASESNTTSTRRSSTNPTHGLRLPPPEPGVRVIPGLKFFSFPGAEDGEDLKVLFKARIVEAEILLTEGEKEDIVREAGFIFTHMLQLVNQLDAVIGTTDGIGAGSGRPSANGEVDARGRPLSACRDSVSVAKERMSRETTDEKKTSESSNRSPVTVSRDEDGSEKAKRKSSSNSFLRVITIPLATTIIQFRGRIPTFDQVVRRFSKPQVTFATGDIEVDVDGKEKIVSENEVVMSGDAGSFGSGSVGLAMPVLAVLLLLVFWLLYKMK